MELENHKEQQSDQSHNRRQYIHIGLHGEKLSVSLSARQIQIGNNDFVFFDLAMALPMILKVSSSILII